MGITKHADLGAALTQGGGALLRSMQSLDAGAGNSFRLLFWCSWTQKSMSWFIFMLEGSSCEYSAAERGGEPRGRGGYSFSIKKNIFGIC